MNDADVAKPTLQTPIDESLECLPGGADRQAVEIELSVDFTATSPQLAKDPVGDSRAAELKQLR